MNTNAALRSASRRVNIIKLHRECYEVFAQYPDNDRVREPRSGVPTLRDAQSVARITKARIALILLGWEPDESEWQAEKCDDEFGGDWRACVRAGLRA